MKIAPKMIVASIVGFACLAVTPGCDLSYHDKDESDDQQTSDAGDETDSTSTDTDQIDSSAEPGFGGDYVAGDPADAGEEIYRSNWQGHDVRCLGADYDGDGYFMSDVIDDTDALDLGSDGTASDWKVWPYRVEVDFITAWFYAIAGGFILFIIILLIIALTSSRSKPKEIDYYPYEQDDGRYYRN